jgi:hypothetical protein
LNEKKKSIKTKIEKKDVDMVNKTKTKKNKKKQKK